MVWPLLHYRLARDKLRNFEPRFLVLAAVDYLQMLLYVAAYICTVSWQQNGVLGRT